MKVLPRGKDVHLPIARTLFLLQNEARKLNHQEVVEEDRRNKLPTNWEAKKRRLEWEEEEERKRKVS